MIKTVCVFCGSSLGAKVLYKDHAINLAQYLLKNQISLVYGGANVGLMSILADTMLKGGGKVTGVMPESLVRKEVAHAGLTEMKIVANMQERKLLMAKFSDAFITLPGAFGTMDELFEILTWNQLGFIRKPIGILNAGGYFNALLELLDHSVSEKFLRQEHRDLLIVDKEVHGLFEKLRDYHPATAEKWIERLKQGKI
jgi:hypothetical protein